MTCHATTLQILYISVVYQLDREWCPSSLGITTFVVMLLVRKMHVWVHINETVICGLYRHCLRWFLLNLSIVSIQEGVIGRRSRVARNFLSKFEEKVTSLGRWWCTKESKRGVKNIWRCHLGQSRERVECVRRWYVGRPTWSSRDGPGILETEPSAVSSCVTLGYILLWFAIQVFWVKIWAMRLV
jgi:hypothetical protein